MSTETMSNAVVAEHNRTVARRWIDAFNARDAAAEAAARTADYIAHAPDSIQTAALDSDAWVEFLGVFLEGFPDLHLEVQDSAADEGMVAWADPVHPVPRHDLYACELPMRGSLSTVAVAMRLAVWIRVVGDVRRGGDGPDRRRADSL